MFLNLCVNHTSMLCRLITLQVQYEILPWILSSRDGDLSSSVSRTAQLVFEFPTSVSSVGHRADVNSLCPDKLSINLFELA